MVYVDEARHRYRNMIMCHMIADTLEELHEMADKIGINRKWFQGRRTPHYDISPSKRSLALKQGTQVADRKKIVELINKYRKGGGSINVCRP